MESTLLDNAFFQHLMTLDEPLLEDILVFFCAALVAYIAPLKAQLQPLQLLSYLAIQLANKVNRPNRSPKQQMIAGSLSILLLGAPFWIIMSALFTLTEEAAIFEGLILYVCLTEGTFNPVAHHIANAIQRNNTAQAKTLLQPWVSCDTAMLSEIGLAKATLEKLVTMPVYGFISTIIFFMLAGAPTALAIRILKQLELSWPAVNPKYQYFSIMVYAINTVLFAIPAWLWSLSIAMQTSPSAIRALLKITPSRYPLGNDRICINILAYALKVELGGPQKFAGVRVGIEKLPYGPLPQSTAIMPAIRLIKRTSTLWLVGVMMPLLIWLSLPWLQGL